MHRIVALKNTRLLFKLLVSKEGVSVDDGWEVVVVGGSVLLWGPVDNIVVVGGSVVEDTVVVGRSWVDIVVGGAGSV